MAEPDPNERAVVISVVYDGPPRAGKTTSVRALARSFGREVYTPEERNGRTVYFDWLEHVGGRFDGLPIRCQVASVPGQRHWKRRRAHFLDRADVVVFVGDTTRDGWPETVERLAELRAMLDDRDGVPVGLVFQANKRDCEDAVSSEEIRQQAASARIAVVESIAEDGSGVREAFVFAVRLALDRVREQGTRDRAGFGSERGDDLVDLLRGLVEGDSEPPPLPPAPTPDRPRPPSQDAPSGFIWPPVEGRIVLREATIAAVSSRTEHGDWVAELGAWSVHSDDQSIYTDLDEARRMLVSWARKHASAQELLSRRRCIVLAETGDGRWRLWQIVRTEASLRERKVSEPERSIASVEAACRRLDIRLPCTIDTIGISDAGQPVFIGLMPAVVG